MAILAMITGMVGSPALRAEDNISLDFRDADIRDLLKIIAQKSGTNIIAEKSVRGNVTVRLTDVYYEEAMNLIAKTNGFAVRKIGNTWILANEKVLADGFEKGLTITKRLQYAKAADVSKIISSTIKKDVKVATDERINAVIVSGGKDILEETKKLIETIDTPVHQVMIESKIVEVTTKASKAIGFQWRAGTEAGGMGGLESDTDPPIFSTTEYFAKNPNADSYQQALPTGRGALFGLGDFYRNNLMFAATFSALERFSDTKILSNPKISAINGMEANIMVGRKVVYPGGADQPPKEKDTGIKLKITPRINDDGYITVDAEPEVSFVEDWRGSYPVIGNRSAKTTVRVRDGEEILIGGLIREEESNSNAKIPLLGSLPIVKSLFTRRERKGESQELIILITPHIVAQSIESAGPTSMVPEGGGDIAPVTSTPPASPRPPEGKPGDGFDGSFDSSF
jgi:type IV pilus assembly protein PilQ